MSPLEFITFVAAVLLLYYALPPRAQGAVLLAASIFYCLSIGVPCFVLVLEVTLTTYFASILIKRKRSRFCIALSVLSVLSPLILFKLSALMGSDALALYDNGGAQGLAFYSLSAAGYLIDVYRGRTEREPSLWRLLLFISFFPCMRLGPVSRYDRLSPQLASPHTASWDNIVSGAIRVAWGYFKKTVIADTALVALEVMVADPQGYGGGYALLLIVLYSVVIYADFTGGIDVALGVGGALGITLAENFDRPFSSTTPREYWRRWHISLGAWFSDYVFYPLSISKPMQRLSKRLRRGRFKKLGKRIPVHISITLTWLLTGAWHGLKLNFMLWGISNAAVIIVWQELTPIGSRLWGKRSSSQAGRARRAVSALVTFFVIGSIRLFDLWGDATVAPKLVASIFGDLSGWRELSDGGIMELGLSLYEWIVIALGVFVMLLVSRIRVSRGESVSSRLAKRPLAATACIVTLTLSCLIFGAYGVGFDSSSFIYSQF